MEKLTSVGGRGIKSLTLSLAIALQKHFLKLMSRCLIEGREVGGGGNSLTSIKNSLDKTP